MHRRRPSFVQSRKFTCSTVERRRLIWIRRMKPQPRLAYRNREHYCRYPHPCRRSPPLAAPRAPPPLLKATSLGSNRSEKKSSRKSLLSRDAIAPSWELVDWFPIARDRQVLSA